MNELVRNILMLPEQASTVARDIDLLHYAVIITTLLGATAVTLVTAIFIVRYRAKGPHTSAMLHERAHGGVPVWVEVVAIGLLLALFVAFWVVGYRQLIALQTIPANTIDIYVVGKKWMWSFAYPNGAGSNSKLYVPARRPVKLILTSRDVIHSFYVPQFRIKQDAVPGQATLTWFEAKEPGTYDIFCAEYCGTGHSAMLGQVEVVAEEDYERMLENLPATAESELLAGRRTSGSELTSLAQVGERVASRHGCLRCHTTDGSPHLGPTWAGAFGSTVSLANGEQVIVDEAYITESMMDPLAKLHRGFDPIMPSYQGLLSAGETGAIVEFLRALRDVPPGARQAPLAPSAVPSHVALPRAAATPTLGQDAATHVEALPPVREEGPPFPPPGLGPRSNPAAGERGEP